MNPAVVSAAADVATALATIATVGIAIAAWRVARETFARDHRPIVRVVPLYDNFAPIFTREQTMLMDSVVLKNIGRGVGLTGLAYDPARDAVIGDIETIEPLGDGANERTRLGRVGLQLRESMTMLQSYELYYQDTLGAWHVTVFRPIPWKIECSFKNVPTKKVPGVVQVLGTIARP